jgi:hypothetical protein
VLNAGFKKLGELNQSGAVSIYAPHWVLEWRYPYYGPVRTELENNKAAEKYLKKFREDWDVFELSLDPGPYRLINEMKQFNIWEKKEGGAWVLTDGEPPELKRIWPEDLYNDPRVGLNLDSWLFQEPLRWNTLKAAESAIKTMMADLEGSKFYNTQEVLYVYGRMQKLIDYNPATPEIEEFPEHESSPEYFSIDPETASSSLVHGPLYEYYYGCLPREPEYDFKGEEAGRE